MKIISSTTAIFCLIFCATAANAKDDLPSNVTTKPFGGGNNKAIDTIDYAFSISTPIQFSRVKMCVVENITNNEVQLSDSAGSFVGRSGTYYQAHNGSTVQGGDVFKYVDDTAKSLVARGSINRRAGFGGIIRLAIRFDVEISVSDANIKIKMLHIDEAMTSTGSASNDGFRPIGIWTGSMYKKDIVALDGLADQLNACLTN
jgi:hypothetical protein